MTGWIVPNGNVEGLKALLADAVKMLEDYDTMTPSDSVCNQDLLCKVGTLIASIDSVFAEIAREAGLTRCKE